MESSETPTTSTKKSCAGPFHVLMATDKTASSPKQRLLLLDPGLQNDYVAKRKEAYAITKANGDNNGSVWDGVSKVERELVGCCQKPEKNEDDSDVFGTLDIEKEIQFAGIIALHCHTMAARCLALAILERTLDTSLHEIEEDEDEDEDSENEDEEELDEEIEGVASDDERDDDWKPGKRRSPRRQNDVQRKRQKINDEKVKDKKEDEDEDDEVGRLEQFLAAGGLKILNRWLVEASTEDVSAALKSPPGSNKKPKPKTPAGRPLILPILRFLEKIPFDKKLVMDSKINKQIRKLGKQVDLILETRAQGRHRKEDLQNWTTEPTTTETDALGHVQEAIDNVKKSWEQMAKNQNEKFTDPFKSLKEKMRKRLEVLTKFETREIPKPDWLVIQEGGKDSKKTTTKSKKLSTKELADKERKSEAEDHLRNALRAAADEHRERLEKIRETLRKRREESAPSNRQKKDNGKRVVWKDNLRTQTNRNRKLLEEVYLFEKRFPASRRGGFDENTDYLEDEESDENVDYLAAEDESASLSLDEGIKVEIPILMGVDEEHTLL